MTLGVSADLSASGSGGEGRAVSSRSETLPWAPRDLRDAISGSTSWFTALSLLVQQLQRLKETGNG
jgi:hypothetical protein